MSTRCNIKITSPDRTPLYLYRHWNGYLAKTGANVVEVANRANKWHGFGAWCNIVNGFLSQFYEREPNHKPSPVYEVTDAAHGDIECFYWIEIVSAGITIHHATGYGPELEAETKAYTLDQFTAFVNEARAHANTRIEELKRVSPDYYADAELYPML